MADSFVHLHVHTEYSMLDGAARLKQMFAEVERQKMPAIAMTDHGNMHGAYEFHKHAMAAGVTPIIGCLLPGQEIITADGVKNVEDVQVGDLVLTHRGRFRRVLRTMRRPYSGRAYTIELAGRYGRSLTLTEEHPVLVRTPDGLVDWKKPGDIAAGRRTGRGGAQDWNSWACLPKLAGERRALDVLPLLPAGFSERSGGGVRRSYESEHRADQSWPALPSQITLDHDFGYLLGLYAAEGHLETRGGELTGGIGLTLNQAEQELGDRWRTLLRRFEISTQTYRRPEKGSQEIKACCVPLAFMLRALVGCGARDKKVPQCVLDGPAEARAGFLEGFLDGDGRFAGAASNPSGRRDIKVASRSLAWGVRALLADRGHWSTVSSGVEKGDFPQGHSDREYRWYQVSYKPERAYSRTLEDDEYLYRPIGDVHEVELECEVFNFEVEEDNSYVSDFILHNCEAYMAPESRFHKKKVQWGEPSQKRDDVSGGGLINHMTLWARNKTGLHNLFKLSSRAYTEGFVFKYARMDEELLAEHADGVMATTGCPSGKVQTRLRLGQFDEALKAAATFQDILGKENYFLELMDHGLDIERNVRQGLLDIGKKLNIPPVVTNDSHYTHESEATAHDALLCVQVGKQLADPDRFRFNGSGYYLKTADEMRGIDSSDAWQEGCRNTLLIAERVEPEGMFEYRDLMPRFPVPEGETEETWFRKEVWKGLERRFPGGVPEEYKKQAEYEMGVILGKGYPSYFLVVADFIMWAKENGILVGPGRGSAAGSLVAYAMGITDLDPLPHGLIFERFLNPERASMPDIDIDFPEDRRAEVIKYTTEKWGADKVSFIATFGTIKAKAAIKDAGRVLGFPYALGDRISKAFPPAVMGKDIPLSGIFDEKHPRYGEAGELRKLYEEENDVKQIMDLAQGLEGLIRQTGVHAAGIIMSGETITDHVPIMRRDADGAIITQFDYPTCETLGLLKMDFLGLRNLTIIDDALQGIRKNKGVEVNLLELPLDDQPTYDLLARGDTLGVFQFDGGPMRSLLRLMKPDNFEDISAVGALYRPGPMGANSHTNYALRKNGQQEITPIHPELEEPLKDILGTTYGLIVYQEQVMAIAQKVAGYTLGKADLLRRVMGKKKKAELDAQFEGFEAGMLERGYSKEAVKTLWDILVPFSDYAFNKAHSAAYGLVSYWTAYLKANYPAEYMAALLTSVGDDKDKSALYLSECRRMGLKVLPPDVNTSEADFTPLGDTEIRFGLSAVRNVGTNVVDGIVAARKEKGAYTDFNDFLNKVPPIVCNKRVVESLIKAGGFDELGHERKALLMVHEQAIDSVIDIKRKEAIGQDSLFGALEDDGGEDAFAVAIPEGEEWDKTTLLAFEREMLGLYVSDHPLLGVEHILEREADCAIASLNEGERPDGQIVVVAGLLSGLQRKVTKQGNSWAMFQLEDLAGSIEVLCFPSAYQLCSTLLAEDAILIVKGKLDRREDVAKIIAMEVVQPDLTVTDAVGPLSVSLPLNRCTPPTVSRLKEVLTTHPGSAEVHLHLQNGPRTTVVRLDDRLRVSPSPALMGDLKQLLGPSCLG